MDKQTKKAPIISVVTPSYNQALFIEETIKSVLNQEGDFYIDYIIVDGGSTDHTVEVIKRYDSALSEGTWPVRCLGIRYRWVSEKDRGQADAIVKGFCMAEGDILAWLNSDDTYRPSAINNVLEYFNNHYDTGMLYGKTYFIDEKSNIIGKYPTEPFDYDRLSMFTFITQPSTFFKKEVYFSVGGVNAELHYTMDFDLWVRIARKYKVEYLPEFLSTYRLHGESKTMSDSYALRFHEEYIKTIMRYYKWAPANRVYGFGYHLTKYKLPTCLSNTRPLIVFIALLVSVVKYLSLNKKIRLEDIKMISPNNIRKLFKDWIDVLKGYES